MKKALTLIEVLVAIVIFSFISVAIYSLLQTGISVRKRVILDQNAYQSTCLTLDRVAQELRNTIFFQKDTPALKGDSQEVQFYTIVFDYPTNAPKVLDITYTFQGGKLIKTINEPLDEDEVKEKKVVVLDNIKKFEFSYFGEAEETESWLDKWQADELPDGVKISLVYEDERQRQFDLNKYIFIYNENTNEQ